MTSPENYNAHVESDGTEHEVTIPESIPETRSPEEQAILNRRNFLRILGSAALAGAALSATNNAEARDRKRWVPEINENEHARAEAERYMQSEANVDYVGFRPSKHQAIFVKARLKQIVPDALSAEIFLERPKGSSLVTMRISVIKSDSSRLKTDARYNVSSRDVGRDADFTPALDHLFNRFQTEHGRR